MLLPLASCRRPSATRPFYVHVTDAHIDLPMDGVVAGWLTHAGHPAELHLETETPPRRTRLVGVQL
jgi:hypothetical protein